MLYMAALSLRDERARKRILEMGEATDREHLRAYEWHSNWVVDSVGSSRSEVCVPGELETRLRDPEAEIYIHHNHPNGAAFSREDLVLALDMTGRARGKLYAHGHDGSSYGVMFANRPHIDLLHRFVSERVQNVLVKAVTSGRLPRAAANCHFAHVICLAFGQIGMMHYEFALSQSRLDDWCRYANSFDEAVQAATDAIRR